MESGAPGRSSVHATNRAEVERSKEQENVETQNLNITVNLVKEAQSIRHHVTHTHAPSMASGQIGVSGQSAADRAVVDIPGDDVHATIPPLQTVETLATAANTAAGDVTLPRVQSTVDGVPGVNMDHAVNHVVVVFRHL